MPPPPNESAVPAGELPTSTSPSATFSLRGRVAGFAVCAALLIAAFIKPLIGLVLHAAHSELHSHILLVPFVTAYLLWIRREELPRTFSSSPGWALLAALFGGASLMAAVLSHGLSYNDHLALLMLAFLGFLVALGFLFLGRAWMWSAAFPVFFLIFIVPMPDGMADNLETASKLASTEAANLFFIISGTPNIRDGTTFQLPNIAIQVGQQCSGIRSSWVLVITSLLASNLFLTSNWRRAVLVAFVFPLGIIRNGFRVFVIGTLCIHFGPQMIHSIIHHKGGPLFFALSLIPLFLLLWWLRRGDDRQVASDKRSEISGQKSAVSGPYSSQRP